MKNLIILSVLVLSSFIGFSQTKITAQEASKHIGDSVLVLDKVYGGIILSNAMTLLNVGNDFPNHLLVVMIRSEDRAKFKFKPEEQFKGKQVIISGRLIEYKGKPAISVSALGQIIETDKVDSKLPFKKQ
jgi:hypothetical protein